jgi:hypothetical protein
LPPDAGAVEIVQVAKDRLYVAGRNDLHGHAVGEAILHLREEVTLADHLSHAPSFARRLSDNTSFPISSSATAATAQYAAKSITAP